MSFSLANIIKQKRVQCEALQNVLTTKQPMGSQEWWEDRKILVEDWIRSNPLRLGVPNDGCIEAMQYSLKRGDENNNPVVRRKCWNHILLELQEIPDFQAGLEKEKCTANVKIEESDLLVAEVFKMMARQTIDIDECSASSYFPSPRFTDEIDTPESMQENHDNNNDYLSEQREETDEQQSSSVAHAEGATIAIAATSSTTNNTNNNGEIQQENNKNKNIIEEKEAIEQQQQQKLIDADETASTTQRRVSLVQRQESWLQSRQNRLYNKRKEQEEKLQEGFTFAPDIQKSKKTFQKGRSYREANIGGAAGAGGASFDELVPMESVSSVTTTGNKKTSSSSGSRNRPSLDRQSSTNSSSSKTPKVPKLRRRGSGESRGSDKGSKRNRANIKRKSSGDVDASSIVDDDSTIALSRTQSIDYDADDMTNADDATINEDVTDEKEEKLEPQQTEGKDETTSKEASEGEELKQADKTTGSDWGYQVIEDFVDKVKFEPNKFYDVITGGRGHLKIRSGHDFQMRTMYRKRDRLTRDRGVSLLVGRTEKSPHDEKVITIMFDLETFTEHEAYNWWHENKRRFADQQSVIRRMRYGNN